MSISRLVALGSVAVVLSAGVASATMTEGTWILDQSNTFADGTEYGSVHIEADTSTGTVSFTVTAADVQPAYGSLNKFGIQKFGFNYDGINSAPSAWDIDLPNHWSQNTNSNISGFGWFDLAEVTSGANHRLPILQFEITLPNHAEAIADNFAVPSSGNAGEGNAYFVAHVAGFGNGPGSHYVGGSTSTMPVPEPTGVALLACGVFFILHRRPRTSQHATATTVSR